MRGNRSRVVTATAAVWAIVVGASAGAQADDWPCFRGPNRDGVSTDKGLPLEWSDTKNVIWKTELPGAGASSPITFGDRIYLTCYSGYGVSRESPGKYEDLRRHVVCFSRQDGKILWDAAFPNRVPDDHYGNFTNLHGYASSTPAADETGVYVFFGTTGARAYSHAGDLKWERSCGKRYTNFGSASSPILFGDLLWECVSLDSYLNPSPIAHEGIIYAIGCHPNRAVAIRAGGRGDVTLTHKVWDIKHGSEVGTPVFYEGHLYWANEESGIAYCINAATGDVVYKQRLEPRPDRIYASGVIADGKLYYVSRENGTFMLPAAPRYQLLAHNTIETDESVFNATPAISRGQLLLRSDKYLYCIGLTTRR